MDPFIPTRYPIHFSFIQIKQIIIQKQTNYMELTESQTSQSSTYSKKSRTGASNLEDREYFRFAAISSYYQQNSKTKFKKSNGANSFGDITKIFNEQDKNIPLGELLVQDELEDLKEHDFTKTFNVTRCTKSLSKIKKTIETNAVTLNKVDPSNYFKVAKRQFNNNIYQALAVSVYARAYPEALKKVKIVDSNMRVDDDESNNETNNKMSIGLSGENEEPIQSSLNQREQTTDTTKPKSKKQKVRDDALNRLANAIEMRNRISIMKLAIHNATNNDLLSACNRVHEIETKLYAKTNKDSTAENE